MQFLSHTCHISNADSHMWLVVTVLEDTESPSLQKELPYIQLLNELQIKYAIKYLERSVYPFLWCQKSSPKLTSFLSHEKYILFCLVISIIHSFNMYLLKIHYTIELCSMAK